MSFFQKSRSSSPEPVENTFSPCTDDVPVEPLDQSVDIENIKRKLREQAILEQYSKNDQCFYYGTINNKNKANEPLVKFGNSNDLSARVNVHRKVYDGFCLVNAFRVQNKMQVENALKEHPILSKYRRKVEIKGIQHNEVLAMDKLSFDDLNKIIRSVIDSTNFSSTNYVKLLLENEFLKSKIEIMKQGCNDNVEKFHCKFCDYTTIAKGNFKMHLKCKKHIDLKQEHEIQNNANCNFISIPAIAVPQVFTTIPIAVPISDVSNNNELKQKVSKPVTTTNNTTTTNYSCEKCKYTTLLKGDYKRHLLSKRHNSTGEETEHRCKHCNYSTTSLKYYKIHLASKKHAKNSFMNKNNLSPNQCEFCKKLLSSKSSLWRHKKTCDVTVENIVYDDNSSDIEPENVNEPSSTLSPVTNAITPELLFNFMKQTMDLQKIMIEKQNMTISHNK
jgi:hypothetical protein